MHSAPHLLRGFATSRGPAADLPRTPSAHVVLVASLSLAAHVALATSLGHGQASRAKVTPRTPTRIDIQVRRAPPPPPPAAITPPPEVARPEPPRPARARSAPSAPAAPPPDVAAAPPVSAEGTLPPGPEPQTLAPAPVIAAPSAPVAATPAPAPTAPRREEAREGANYRHNPRPAYPRIAQREGWEGTVTLRVQVLPNGRPATIRVARSSGREALDDAALETVRGWSFTPATLDGEPTTGWVSVPIAFRLSR